MLGLELIGGEIADTRFRIRRRVRPDDPADLGAPLSYAVEVLAADDENLGLEPAAAALSKSRQWVLTACGPAGSRRRSSTWGPPRPGRPPAQAPHHPDRPRRARACRLAAGSEEGNGRARYWSPTTPDASVGDGEVGAGEATGMP